MDKPNKTKKGRKSTNRSRFRQMWKMNFIEKPTVYMLGLIKRRIMIITQRFPGEIALEGEVVVAGGGGEYTFSIFYILAAGFERFNVRGPSERKICALIHHNPMAFFPNSSNHVNIQISHESLPWKGKRTIENEVIFRQFVQPPSDRWLQQTCTQKSETVRAN